MVGQQHARVCVQLSVRVYTHRGTWTQCGQHIPFYSSSPSLRFNGRIEREEEFTAIWSITNWRGLRDPDNKKEKKENRRWRRWLRPRDTEGVVGSWYRDNCGECLEWMGKDKPTAVPESLVFTGDCCCRKDEHNTKRVGGIKKRMPSSPTFIYFSLSPVFF